MDRLERGQSRFITKKTLLRIKISDASLQINPKDQRERNTISSTMTKNMILDTILHIHIIKGLP